jgi:hypothetical protein
MAPIPAGISAAPPVRSSWFWQIKMQPFEIRDRVFSLLRQMARETETRETLLILDDHYLGHRYRCGRYTADWLVEDARITISNDTGRVVRNFAVAELFQETQKIDRQAA